MELLFFALYLGLAFIFFQLILFIINTRHFHTLPNTISDPKLRITILIPARNEEISIQKCLTSVVNQSYTNLEIIVLDDNSTDNTPGILKRIKDEHPDVDLKLMKGLPKPDHWLGKNWACHQLSEKATGQVLVFIDADTQLESGFIESVNTAIQDLNLDALTIWPHQVLRSFWEKVVIPQLYYVIYTLLPIKYTFSDPKWMPKSWIPKLRASFAAACGQCMIFTRQAYDIIGGHDSVRDQVVEDVQLARRVRAENLRFRMFHGNDTFSCRMYSNQSEIFQGFRKNFLAGFDYNIPFFLFSWVLHVFAYVLPWIAFVIGLLENHTIMVLTAGIMIMVPVSLRFMIDSINRWELSYSPFHILGVLWFNRLALIVLIDRIAGRKVTWKNRSL